MRWLSNKCTMHQTLSARKVKNILLLQQYDQPLTGYQGTLRQLKHSLVQLTCKKKKNTCFADVFVENKMSWGNTLKFTSNGSVS